MDALVLLYHYMVEGSCLITLEGMAPLRLNAGDIIVFPHGDAHTMASSIRAQPQQMDAKPILSQRPAQFGGGGEITRLICGYRVCDPRLFQPVLAALPRVVTVSLPGMAALAGSLASARRRRGELAPALTIAGAQSNLSEAPDRADRAAARIGSQRRKLARQIGDFELPDRVGLGQALEAKDAEAAQRRCVRQ